jgi:predicted RNA-binding protein YlqC (UPF0109 family)
MSTTKVDLSETLQAVVSPLVSEVDAIRITSRATEAGLILTLRVSQDETGRIIGRGGETIRSIRTVMAAAARAAGTRLQLDVPDA